MRNPLSSLPTGPPFRLFGTSHRVALAVTGSCIAALLAAGRRMGPTGRRRTRRLLVGALWGQEVAYHAWKAASRTWNLREMLPLHLCSVLVWSEGVALLRPTRLGDEFAWFWGVTGAPQALLTPDVGAFGYPHFRFFQFFASHGLILTIPLWMVVVEGRRPSPAGGLRTFAGLLAHAAVVHQVNRLLGSNYLFLERKPPTASVLDRLPPWPRYVPVLIGLAGGLFAVAAIPLALARRR